MPSTQLRLLLFKLYYHSWQYCFLCCCSFFRSDTDHLPSCPPNYLSALISVGTEGYYRHELLFIFFFLNFGLRRILYCNVKLPTKKKQKPIAIRTEGMYHKFSMRISDHLLQAYSNSLLAINFKWFSAHLDVKQRIPGYTFRFYPQSWSICIKQQNIQIVPVKNVQMIFRLIKLENPWNNSNGVFLRIAALTGNLTADERRRCQK